MSDSSYTLSWIAAAVLGIALFAALRSVAPADRPGSRDLLAWIASVLFAFGVFTALGMFV